VLLALLCVIAYVYAHAVSIVPPAWNPNPSTTNPCGAGQNTNSPVATWTQNTQASITWQVVAADGAGPVSMIIDTTGAQNFAGTTAVKVPLVGATPGAVGTFQFTAAIPAVTCTGPKSTCTVQLATTNWFSCATVSIVNPNSNATAAPTVAPNCYLASGLTFCTWMNGQYVTLPAGSISPITMDWNVQDTYNLYLGKPNVFQTPNGAGCLGWYKKFLCGLNFQPCGANYGKGGCYQGCVNTNSFCTVDPSHITLYNCTNYPNTVSDLTGNCNGAQQVQVSALVIISALISMVVFLF